MEQGLGMVKGQLLLYPTLNMANVEMNSLSGVKRNMRLLQNIKLV